MKIVLGNQFYPDKDQTLKWAEKAGVNLVWVEEISEEYGVDVGHWELDGEEFYPTMDIERTDPVLIELIEKGEWGEDYRVVDIPDGVDWYLASDEMGYEWIAERHRTWG